jgi:hypothetical protein
MMEFNRAYKTEYLLHLDCVEYIEMAWPDVWFYSDLNGVRVTKGTAGKIKAIQMKDRKWLDIYFSEPRGPYHGLYIELKNGFDKVFKKDGTLKKSDHLEAQQHTIDEMLAKGYYACFSWCYEHFVKTVDEYLSLDGDRSRVIK